MRKCYSGIACLILSCMLVTASLQKAHAQEVVVSYQTFYDEMSPYGQWVSDPEYGNVWVPNEAPGYRPYGTGGHWAMTEYGNMWVSDAPYGWACYHYGRWTYNPYYGWVWIPGHEWAPAWVSWRSGGGYYGWAPMGPGYVAGGTYEYPDNYWVFVEPSYLYHEQVYSYYGSRRSDYYITRTTYINETYVDNGSRTTYYYGPRREVVERETHQPVQVYRVSNANAPGAYRRGSDNVVQVYRPGVNRETERSSRPSNLMPATQPVGKPQEISRRDERREPEFHQQMQRQNPALSSPNNYGGNSRGQQEPQNTQRQNVSERPQGQHFNQNNNPGRPEPQPNNGQQRYNQPEKNNRPGGYNHPGNGYNQQPQPGRQQPPPNQQMNRPQAQPQPQQGRPQSQPKPQAKPQSENESKKGR